MRLTALQTLAFLAGLVLAGPAVGQTQQPFDMSGEQDALPPTMQSAPPTVIGGPQSPATIAVAPAAPGFSMPEGSPTQAPAPAARRFVAPNMVPPQDERSLPSRSAEQAVPVMASLPAVAQTIPPLAGAPAAQAAPVPTPDAGIVRSIIPQSALRLEGEIDQRAWSIYLTANEAARDAVISVSYKNAVVVMPEASRLRMLINGVVVLETQIASADRFKAVSAKLPSDLLHGGSNLLRIQAVQRHRTDCSPQSTYELWTDIDPAATHLTLAGQGAPDILTSLTDLPAVGYASNGVTAIHIVAPSAPQAAAADATMKLAQALALLGGYPNPFVTVTTRSEEPDPRGTLTVLLGTGQEINPLLSTPITATAPTVTFVNEPRLGTSVLVVSGGGWGQVMAAAKAIAASTDRPPGDPSTVLNTAAWSFPDVHLFEGSQSLTFADLGVATQQFSGRRFRTQFHVGIPADFYAQAYGEATILLDAAYTSAVLPASHIDIYVNGQIAATTRITTRTGGIFRHLPVKISFRHFRPGVNTLTMEAILNTVADAACPPGGSIAGADRFVLFDTSEFSMPDFARIGRRPDLDAFAGSAFPYLLTSAVSPLVLGRYDLDTVSAAATLVGRLAIQAGKIVPFALTPAANVGRQTALFVGAAPEFSGSLLAALGIASSVAVNWKSDIGHPMDYGSPLDMTVALSKGAGGAVDQPADDVEPPSTDAVFDRWRRQLAGGGGWSGQVSSFEDWMKRHFDISFASFRIGPAPDVSFEPRMHSTLLMAQSVAPGGSGTWTIMTAPSSADLANAARSVVAVSAWRSVSGQFSWYTSATGQIENQPVANYQFVRTQPLSIQNTRFIAANWFSSNIIFYAFCLIGLCVVLGIITSGLISRLGRPS